MLPALLLLLAASSPARAGLPSGYAKLLSDEKIAASILWDGERGPVLYPAWTGAQKADLARAIEAREEGRPAGLEAPPSPLDPGLFPPELAAGLKHNELEDESAVFISSGDAWRLYLAHIAHSLWLETNAKVPWTMKAMNGAERALLLDSRRMMARSPLGPYRVSRYLMGHALSWDPAQAYRFLEREGMLPGAAPKDVVLAAARWANLNLRHIIAPSTFEELYAYSGPPPLDRILFPAEEAPRRVGGCWGVTGFFAALLRGANVPVANVVWQEHHSRPVFPTAGLTMRHGDDIYHTPAAASGNRVAPERLLMTLEEWDRLVESPVLDCEGSRCNSKEEQVEYNLERRLHLIGRDFLTDYAMSKYAELGPAAFDEAMRGDRDDDGKVKYFVKPLLSEEERRSFTAALEAELKRLGGGDADKGKKIVDERLRAFYR